MTRHIRPGSSPRMRGARYEFVKPADHAGIIPADAGSTSMPVSMAQWEQDHPRGCGEHGETQVSGVITLGSSPRMRGAPPT